MKTANKTMTTGRWNYGLYCVIATLFLGGCQNEDSYPIEDNHILIQASINSSQLQTRVTEPTEEGKSNFEEKDEIGIFVIDNITSSGIESDGILEPTGNHADNVRHILDKDKKWINDGNNNMLWTNNQSLYLTAYYPYQATLTDGVTDMTKVSFQVKTDQSAKENGATRTNYQLSDLLWARSSNTKKETGSVTNPVELKFNHALSKATINLKFNDEFKEPDGNITLPSAITVSVVGTNTKALVNFRSEIKASPSYKPNPNWEDDKSSMTAEKGIAIADAKTPSYDAIISAPVITANAGFHKTYQAIVVPQTIQNNTLIKIKVTISGKEKVYNYTPDKFEFKSGLHHIFNITVGSYDLTVTTNITDAINDWGNGEVSTGDTEKASLLNGNYWATSNQGITDANRLGALYTWSASPCPAGYRLPTVEEYAAILPTTATNFAPAGSNTSGNDQYYADGVATIYGIKKASDNTRYWIRWQYLATSTATSDKYLKISYWTDQVDDATSLPTTGTDAEKLSAIKTMLPKSQPQTLILPATSSSGTEGDYWTSTKDKYIRFNATTITPDNTVTAGETSKTCSVRCIQIK